jgi:hypothetical protein
VPGRPHQARPGTLPLGLTAINAIIPPTRSPSPGVAGAPTISCMWATLMSAEYQDQHGQPITRDAPRARLSVSNQAAFELLHQLRAAEAARRLPTASHAA